jgi:hypothetical protein
MTLDMVEKKQIQEQDLTIHPFGSSNTIQDIYTVHEIVPQSNKGREKKS